MKTRNPIHILFFLTLSLLFTDCGTKQQNNSVSSLPLADDDFFQEITNEAGIRFIHTIGDSELDNIIESVGGGSAFLDFDQDGNIDVFVCNGRWVEGFSKGQKQQTPEGNRLYRNRGDGCFDDVTRKAGVEGHGYGMGVSIGDYNNDGYPDIFISNYGPNELFRNNGNGTFTDVTEKAGVAGGKECTAGAAWFDYDNDSFLDLYVGNYLYFDPNYKYFYAPDGFPGPMAYDPEKDVLYHNNGDGTFEDVTGKMGITDLDGRAMGVGVADLDEDGYVDVYVANDHTLNYLWHNDKGTGFTNRGVMSGTAFSQGGEAAVSMSVDFADYSGDGLLDMFVSDDTYCSLYQNRGNGLYSDEGVSSGISMSAAQFVGWSSSFFDYDNDGDIDITKTNGALKHLYGQESQIFENDGKGKFSDISLKLGKYFSQEYVGRGSCTGDIDNDGDLDLFVTNLNDRCILLRNNKGNQLNWIELNLKGTASNHDAIGARVRLTSGGRLQIAQKRSTTGYLSQGDPRLHFGIGKNDNIEHIEIFWPSGTKQVLENVKANQILTVTEPNSSEK
ncbi:MAG TPA: CRTAC1 family protein [Bacteroidales bacterium]|nr:CRTAC1 family protein [Bacteroidales bacterium]